MKNPYKKYEDFALESDVYGGSKVYVPKSKSLFSSINHDPNITVTMTKDLDDDDARGDEQKTRGVKMQKLDLDFIQEEGEGGTPIQVTRNTQGDEIDSELNREDTVQDTIEDMDFSILELTNRGETQLDDQTELIVKSPPNMDVQKEDINKHLI